MKNLQILNIIIHSSNTELVSLASIHLRIMTPVILIGGIIGIYYGLLITYRAFLLPNISPVLMSLSIIIIIFITIIIIRKKVKEKKEKVWHFACSCNINRCIIAVYAATAGGKKAWIQD